MNGFISTFRFSGHDCVRLFASKRFRCAVQSFALLAGIAGVASAQSTTLGAVKVQETKSATLHFSFDTVTTVAAVKVTTQGNDRLDFTAADTEGCAAGIYAAGSSCVVHVQFAPMAAGLRTGAAVLFGADGGAVASQQISGVGVAPVAVFNPGSQSKIEAGLSNAAAVAVDEAGNHFFADATGGIVSVSSAGVQTVVASGFARPVALALDGAGNIFVADAGRGAILKITRSITGYAAPVSVATGLSSVAGLAVSAAGDLYAAVPDRQKIIAYRDQAAGKPIATFAAGFNPAWLAFDGAGNLFVSSTDTGVIAEVAADGTAATILTGLNAPAALALDAAGNLYAAEKNGRDVVEFFAVQRKYATGAKVVLARGLAVNDIALESNGDLTVATEFTSTYLKISRSQPTLDLGPVDAQQRISNAVENTGNAALTLSAVQISTITAGLTGVFVQTNVGNQDCAAGNVLAVGESCSLGVQTVRTQHKRSVQGTVNGLAQVSSNALNQPVAVNALGLTSHLTTVNQLAFQPALPNSVSAGTSPGIIKVAVEDSTTSAVVTTSTAEITLTVTLPDNSTLTYNAIAVNGIASFNLSLVTLIEAGATSFFATDATDSPALSNVIVLPLATPARLVVSGYPANVLANSAHTLTVAVYDRYNNPATGFTGTVTLGSSDATAIFAPASYTYTSADRGVSTFTVTLKVAGRQSISASTPGATITVSGSQGNIIVADLPGTTALTVNAVNTTTPVIRIAHGAAITLRATVVSGTNVPISPGMVNFLDTTLPSDAQLLNTAQLLSNGTASYSFVPAPGTHSYRAVFTGTKLSASSLSALQTLIVTGLLPTTVTTTVSSIPQNYTLTGTVASSGYGTPTGTVSFYDASNGNALIKTGTFSPLSQQPGKVVGVPITTGPQPQSIVAGDFNGDGFADFAVVNAGDSTVSVMLGHGDGTFTQAPGSPFAVGVEATWIAMGDVNSDGNLDLAVTDAATGTVLILLGHGDGTFAPALPIPAGIMPYAVALGDVNGDGILDMAVTLDGSNEVAVFLGHGDGTFTFAGSNTVGTQPYQVVMTDVNNDGKPDLAVANFAENTVSILLGSGNGTFTAAPNSPVTVGNSPSALVAVDLDADGYQDLAVTNLSDDTVSILLGDGRGNFAPAATPTITVGSQPTAIVSFDIGGSGKPDLVVANFHSSTYTVLLNLGGGNFYTPVDVATGSGATAMAAADLNGDTRPDLIVANYGSQNVGVYLGVQSLQAIVQNVALTLPGAHNVYAVYTGDAYYAGSVSSSIPLTSSAVNTTLALSLSPASATGNYGQAVSLVAAISPSANGFIPLAGTVAFYDNGVLVGTVPTTALTTLALPTQTFGNHLYTAIFSGSNAYMGSSSNSVGYTVQKATSSIGSAGTLMATYGQPTNGIVTLTGQFTGSDIAVPTGSITYQFGTAAVQTAQLVNGQATIAFPTTLPSGPGMFNVTYSGDTNYASTMSALGYVILQATLTVTATDVSRTYGAANPSFAYTATGGAAGDTFNVSYTTAAGPASDVGTYAIVPAIVGPSLTNYTLVLRTGSLTVTPATLIATANNAGRAVGAANPAFTGSYSGQLNGDVFTESFSTPAGAASPAGSYAIVPSVTGPKINDYTVVATNGVLTISLFGATATLTASGNPLNFGTQVTFRVAVASLTTGTPTGTVAFYDGTTLLGNAPITAGVATLSVSTLAMGTHPVSAQYLGDASFAPAISNTVQEGIGSSIPDFTIAAAPASITVAQGQYGTATLTVTPINGYTGTVTLSCSNAPANSLCNFTTTVLTFDGSNTVQASTVTLATTGTTGYIAGNRMPGISGGSLAGFVVLPSFALMGLLFHRRRRFGMKWVRLFSVMLAAVAMIAVSGCSGTLAHSTPTGSFTLTVSGTPSAGAEVHTVQIALTVTQ